MHDIESLKETVVRDVTPIETNFDWGHDTDEQEAIPGFEERSRCIDAKMRLILEEIILTSQLKFDISEETLIITKDGTRQTTLDGFFCKH